MRSLGLLLLFKCTCYRTQTVTFRFGLASLMNVSIMLCLPHLPLPLFLLSRSCQSSLFPSSILTNILISGFSSKSCLASLLMPMMSHFRRTRLVADECGGTDEDWLGADDSRRRTTGRKHARMHAHPYMSGGSRAKTRTFPGAHIGSEHDLVMMTFRVRLKGSKKA